VQPSEPGTPFTVRIGGTPLLGERWPGFGPAVVLVHAGVTDRRSWYATVNELQTSAPLVAYDRRGFGRTPGSADTFSHVDDLLAVLTEVTDEPAWLVGSSAGGGVALDPAISAPERVAGLVLLAPAVSGAPIVGLDAHTARFDRLIERAVEAGDHGELNRLETWLWLDGPAQPEGRVRGASRTLLLEMNRTVIANGAPEDVGGSGIDAWSALTRVTAPTIVACGDLDVPFILDRSRALADRMPNATFHEFAGTAHLPQLEDPVAVAALIEHALLIEANGP
jgi:pimeloyl-ACP methyl ester carboxylesterase